MRGGRVALSLIAAIAAFGAATAVPGGVAAAEYEMTTHANYLVDEDVAQVAITVDIAFKNTFAPPAGQVSLFRTIRVAIHDHAAAVSARDATGALTVTVAVSGGVNVATITPRAPVRYGQTATLTLAYELHDGDDPTIRIGEHLVSFPAWGFGTQSEVRVDLAADYEVRVDGDALEATVEDDRTILTSGAIDDPTHWLTHVGATREPTYDTLQEAVALEGGTADLQVKHWEDDPEWGQATMALVVDALPLLEETFGLPYPANGPLVITETVTAGGPDVEGDNGELAVGFTEPPFTVLHQVAHRWAGESLTGDRWLLEGLASWAAGQVSAELEIDLPYDPAAVAADMSENAFPLAEWNGDDHPPAVDAWAYAASWDLINDAATQAGPAAFQMALARMEAGLDGYDPLTDTPPDPAAEPVTITSRSYLDQLDAVTTEPVVEALATPVLGEDGAAALPARAEARSAHDALLAAAGDWGDPDPVRAAMVEWRFEDAMTEMAIASGWLAERDVLLREIAGVGMTAPERLSAAYRLHGGGGEAWIEIEAERAVVNAYDDAAAAVAAGIDPVARVGLMLGPSPEMRVANAAADFAAGDLRAAADELAALTHDLDTATASGLVRILGLIVAVAAAVLLGMMAMRRRRTGTNYTPEP
jgi:hypothetical protein